MQQNIEDINEFNKKFIYIMNCIFQKLTDIKLVEYIKGIEVLVKEKPSILIDTVGALLYEHNNLIKEENVNKFLELDINGHEVLVKYKKIQSQILYTFGQIKKFVKAIENSPDEKKHIKEILLKLCALYAKYYITLHE